MSSKLIPQPVRMEERPGHFRLPEASRVGIPVHLPESRFLQQLLQNTLGVDLPVVCTDDDEVIPGEIRFEILKQSLAEEAYELEVNPVRLCIRSGGGAGLFYGLQTLRQLLPDGAPVEEIPCLFIQDEPRFGWRGMHLDCARHFLPKGFVLKFLDLMALYKFNRFHWHLTDDQGWRLEIQSFPRLTEVSAWREETLVGHVDALPHSFDGIPHGGIYTREDVSEIVAYAAARHIMVIPEIEMPGHSQAVLAAYPELGCTPGPYETRKIWGISEEVYCAGKEKTFHFLERVLTEVMELFPGPYLHIGGDECPKTRWEQCPACQERIRSESLRDCHELQSYFIKRIDAFLHAHGRTLIGWGEILEGGLAPHAVVMPWRFPEDGVSAAGMGHDVVFAPESHAYFDLCQSEDPSSEPLSIGGLLTLEKVYAYEPVPENLPPENRHHILGAQGQLWTEYLSTPEQVEYMAFPRMTALSEVLWSPKQLRDYSSYLERLSPHLDRLRRMGVCFRDPGLATSSSPAKSTHPRSSVHGGTSI